MRGLLIVLLLAAAGLFALVQLDVVTLGNRGTPAPPDVFALAKSAGPDELRAALAAVNLHARDAYGQTPLMYAAGQNPDPLALELLIDAGADVNARTEAGWTALMYAARDNPNPEVVLTLMKAGADPTVRDAEGKSVIDHASSALRRTAVYRRLEELVNRPFDPRWPSGYTVPVEGATISSRASHLPNAPRHYRNGIHEGFDFYGGTVSVPINYGTPIVAVASGVVIRADHDYQEITLEEYQAIIETARRSAITPPEILDRLRGRQVEIRHVGGFVTRYAHLSAIPPEIQVGVRVAQGTVIGYTGNSGTEEAARGTQDDPHPHVEIWRGDTFLGQGMEPAAIWELGGQVFGRRAVPAVTGP